MSFASISALVFFLVVAPSDSTWGWMGLFWVVCGALSSLMWVKDFYLWFLSGNDFSELSRKLGVQTVPLIIASPLAVISGICFILRYFGVL